MDNQPSKIIEQDYRLRADVVPQPAPGQADNLLPSSCKPVNGIHADHIIPCGELELIMPIGAAGKVRGADCDSVGHWGALGYLACSPVTCHNLAAMPWCWQQAKQLPTTLRAGLPRQLVWH